MASTVSCFGHKATQHENSIWANCDIASSNDNKPLRAARCCHPRRHVTCRPDLEFPQRPRKTRACHTNGRAVCPANSDRSEHNPHRLRGELAVASTAPSLGVNDPKHVTPTIQTTPTELAYEEDKTLRASPPSRLEFMAHSLDPTVPQRPRKHRSRPPIQQDWYPAQGLSTYIISW